MLNELMQCWGSDEGLSRYEVLDVLQEHKYNERNGYKRFGMISASIHSTFTNKYRYCSSYFGYYLHHNYLA